MADLVVFRRSGFRVLGFNIHTNLALQVEGLGLGRWVGPSSDRAGFRYAWLICFACSGFLVLSNFTRGLGGPEGTHTQSGAWRLGGAGRDDPESLYKRGSLDPSVLPDGSGDSCSI